MAFHQLFPSSIWSSQLLNSRSKLHQELLKECAIYQRQDIEGQKWSKANYPGGFTSYATMNRLHQLSPHFAALTQLIQPVVTKMVKNLQMDARPQDIRMSTMWINVMPPGTIHRMHIHPLSVISGTYYVQTPPHSSALRFEDPRLGSYMSTPPRLKNARAENKWFIDWPAREGQLVLFESWLRHEVPTNQSRKPRISISFNLDWN